MNKVRGACRIVTCISFIFMVIADFDLAMKLFHSIALAVVLMWLFISGLLLLAGSEDDV